MSEWRYEYEKDGPGVTIIDPETRQAGVCYIYKDRATNERVAEHLLRCKLERTHDEP